MAIGKNSKRICTTLRGECLKEFVATQVDKGGVTESELARTIINEKMLEQINRKKAIHNRSRLDGIG